MHPKLKMQTIFTLRKYNQVNIFNIYIFLWHLKLCIQFLLNRIKITGKYRITSKRETIEFTESQFSPRF